MSRWIYIVGLLCISAYGRENKGVAATKETIVKFDPARDPDTNL